MAVQFNPRDTASRDIGSTFGLQTGLAFGKMVQVGDKKSKCVQVCCPSEMQIASDFFLVKFGNICLMFGTFGCLSKMTFESYVRLSDWWRSFDSLPTLIVFEHLEKKWITLHFIESVEFAAVEFARGRKAIWRNVLTPFQSASSCEIAIWIQYFFLKVFLHNSSIFLIQCKLERGSVESLV